MKLLCHLFLMRDSITEDVNTENGFQNTKFIRSFSTVGSHEELKENVIWQGSSIV
uniref:Uncharacterized protein n=2 Tax=Anguilla anguilla TaxID=7936 RepID=A0A0E9VAR3_ANGAN